MKVFLSLFIFFASTALAQEVCDSSKLVSSLKLAGLSCETVVSGSCTYDQCEGKVAGYSKPVLFLIPQATNSVRLHFHGHKTGVYSDYEKNLKSMVNAFGILNRICQRNELVIFPESSGNCSDFDRELSGDGINKFISGIHTASGNLVKELPMHLSAHSGGGRTVARILQSGASVDEVTIYDGLYNDWVREELNRWYKLDKKIHLVAVKPGTPYTQMKLVQEKLAPAATPEAIQLNRKPYTRLSQGGVSFQFRSPNTGKDHYDVLSESW